METQIIVPQSFIQQKLKDVFNSEFTKVVSESIDSGIQEFQKQFIDIDKAKDKYYSELSDAKHTDYPQPIDYQGDFKFCGQCMKCKLQDFTNEMTDDQMDSREHLDRYLSQIMSQLSNKERDKLLPNEYYVLCSLQVGGGGSSGNPQIFTLYTNFGRLFSLNYGRGYHNHVLELINERKIIREVSIRENGSGHYVPNTTYSEYTDDIELSQEYIDILNSINFNQRHYEGSTHYQWTSFNRIIHIYKKYHPKASEICKIEMKQKELKQMMRDLQEQEMKYGTQMKELTEYKVTLDEQTKQLQKNQQVHKDKLKNLFQREKAVKMKETLHGCKEELKDIALQLNDMYVLTDSPDEAIQTQLNDILGRLNTLYAEPIQPTIMAQTL